MHISHGDAINSVASQRRRANVRRVADTQTSQDDYEERRSELQRYLVQQRKTQELRGSSQRGARGGQSSSSATEPPPFCETWNGQLQARRRYIPKTGAPSGGTSQGRATGIPRQQPGVLQQAWAFVLCAIALVPSKYVWIVLGLLLLNARRLLSIFYWESTPYAQPERSASFAP